MRIRSIALLMGLTCLTHATAADAVYRLTGNNTKVTFVGTKKDGKHDGGFNGVRGTVNVKDGDVATAQIKVDIDMTTLYTDTPNLTTHLKSRDFFEVQKFPKAAFVSTKIEKKGEESTVTGKLTLHGVTKELSFPAKIEATPAGLSLESNFEINRHDWKVSFGPGRVDDMVKLSLKITASR
jgi:polyisoprenoid-binding protein YceI